MSEHHLSQVSLYRSEKSGSEVLSKPLFDELKKHDGHASVDLKAASNKIIHVSDLDASNDQGE